MARVRSQKGQIAEFAPAMVVFVCFILAPLVDVGILPVRYFIANGVITEYTHTLSLAGSRKKAHDMLQAVSGEDFWWKDFLTNCGMTVHEPKLKLVVCGSNPANKVELQANQLVPDEYLPGGTMGPCVYSMDLAVDIDIPPLYNGGSSGLPGFTAPVTMKLESRSNWENLSRNPVSREFYINEI